MAQSSPLGTVLRLAIMVVLAVVIVTHLLRERADDPSGDRGAADAGAQPVGGEQPPPEPPPISLPPYIDDQLAAKGVPAPGEPEFTVEIKLERAAARNIFHITVTEKHGWAANGVYVDLGHRGLQTREGKGMVADRRLHILCASGPLRFGQPLQHSITVASHEFPELEDFGTSENWYGVVSGYSELTAPSPE
jgi:hypothetical protein